MRRGWRPLAVGMAIALGVLAFASAPAGVAASASVVAFSPGAAPRHLEAWEGSGVVRLAWEAPAAPPSAVLGYRVYRWTGATGPAAQPAPAPVEAALLLADTTSFTDFTVMNGESYTYTVRALYEGKAESPDSPPVTARPRTLDLEVVLVLGQPTALVNGAAVTLDTPPQLVKDRTMVPLRFVGVTLGATVEYDAGARRVTTTLGPRVVKLWIDDPTAQIDGRYQPVDTPPVLKGGRTLVPVRFVAEAFGATVSFDRPTATIRVTLPDPDSDVANSGRLVPGLPVLAALNGPNDTDFYRLRVTPGETYRVKARGLAPDLELVVALADPERGRVVAGSWTGSLEAGAWATAGVGTETTTGTGVEITYVAPPDATGLLIRVQSARPGGAEPAGNYQLQVERDTEPGDSPATAVPLPQGGDPSPATLHSPSDADFYSFTAREGQVLRLRVTTVPREGPLGEPAVAELALDLLSPEGAPLARDDDPGDLEDGGATIVWRCEQDGTYFLRVTSRSGRVGPYAVTVGPSEADGSDGMSQARLTAPDHDTWSDWLSSPGDEDWFAFPAVRGTLYHVQTPSPGGWCDTVLTLVGWDGQTLSTGDDAPGFGSPFGGSLVSWTATYDGLVYARVTSYTGSKAEALMGALRPASGLGRYSFCVTTAAPEGDDQPRAATALEQGDRLLRSLVTQDNDWFRFEARRGRTYTVATGNLLLGCDTALELYDSAGRLLAASDDTAPDLPGRAAALTFTAAFDGPVFVRVYPFLDADGNWSAGLYTLTLAEG